MTGKEQAQWEARLRAAVAETIRRRQARREERAHLADARKVGLTKRHATKTNRRSSN